MNRKQMARLDGELSEFLEQMFGGMGRPERVRAMRWYVQGQLLDGERKSIEPMAARLVDEAGQVEAMRQRLQQCVCVSPWSDQDVAERLACKLDRELPGIEAMVLDDTGFPKKGKHSVGVQRQYSGTLGRTDNCQVAVSLHLAGEAGSGCIAMRLYLPEVWAKDRKRRRGAGVPDEVAFAPKWKIALEQIDSALSWGVRKHVMLADAAFGEVGEFRDGLKERGLNYVVGIKGTTLLWPPGSQRRVARRNKRPGRPRTRYRDERHPPMNAAELATTLEYRTVRWREGSRGWQSSRFAAVRVRTAHAYTKSQPPGDEQWLLCEWTKGKETPSKLFLASLPADTSLKALVRLAKLRWRVERDYQEMKQELGLDHFEGRTWRGFHHHATLCTVAHGFLALRRALSPPIQRQADAA